ncbi:MAG: class I SAM-dependent methyltransferase [Phycisphaeraceae bacterium]|nr:class I SAM-dependent methyltransferase [Phycisphaeraceae bacterium]
MSAHPRMIDVGVDPQDQDRGMPKGWENTDAPMIQTTAVPACPVCQSQAGSGYAQGYDYELETCRNRWGFVHCDDCSHVWLNPRPAVETLSTIYPPSYYAYNYDAQVSPIAVKAKQWIDRMKMAGIRKAMPAPAKSFVDIGCGNGRLLQAMHRLGVCRQQCYGLELDQGVVDSLCEQGFSAHCERVEDCTQIADGSIDLATMFHVIEHVDDPGAVVSRVARWLSEDGVFALETPNVQSLDARLGRKRFWGGYHIPRHWNLFTPKSITQLLEDNGMEVVDIRYQSGHSFWIYSLHHRLRYGTPRMPRLARWCNPFRNLALLALVTAFDRLRVMIGMKTSAMLVIARKRQD